MLYASYAFWVILALYFLLRRDSFQVRMGGNWEMFSPIARVVYGVGSVLLILIAVAVGGAIMQGTGWLIVEVCKFFFLPFTPTTPFA